MNNQIQTEGALLIA